MGSSLDIYVQPPKSALLDKNNEGNRVNRWTLFPVDTPRQQGRDKESANPV